MPAPRTCRACGATLSPHVRWCNACHAPIREFSRRPKQPVASFAQQPGIVYSRWQKGPISFGAFGKLTITAGGVAVAWSQADDLGRFLLVAVLACAGLGIFFAWFNEI